MHTPPPPAVNRMTDACENIIFPTKFLGSLLGIQSSFLYILNVLGTCTFEPLCFRAKLVFYILLLYLGCVRVMDFNYILKEPRQQFEQTQEF